MVGGQAAGMGRHGPVHVCRRPRQQHSYGSRSCSQPCGHQLDQQNSQLSATHIFTPVAIERVGTWHHQEVELVQELGRQATIITGDFRETPYLLQQFISCIAIGELTKSRFKIRLQSTSLLQPVSHFLLNFNV